ncbi:MAG TPA: bifunctional folylpolyglutamate synthase/dihydrofolate synthase, partial [Firmicutes bacterium]|nr:bifunctional folylpolyglutamate synthase/dihydrofolate synthase [Bacillota bacterium]
MADIRANLPELSQEYGAWIFGEIILAAALMWFRDLGARTIVLEAGLGGRLDAGNLFRRPLATCITNVSLEHQGILGNTVEQIAR